MFIRSPISYLVISALLLYMLPANADEAAKLSDVPRRPIVTKDQKPKGPINNSQSYPKQNEATRNDGKTPSCVSSPELSGVGDRKNALPDQKTDQ